MSGHALSREFKKALAAANELTSTAVRVAIVIGDMQGLSDHAFPSVKGLMKATNAGERTVRSAIAELKAAGFLTVRTPSGKSSRYTICTPADFGTSQDDDSETETPAELGTSQDPSGEPESDAGPLPNSAGVPLPNSAPVPLLNSAGPPAELGNSHLIQDHLNEDAGRDDHNSSRGENATLITDRVAAAWTRTYEKHRGSIPSRDYASAQEISRLIRANAPRVGISIDELLVRIVDAYWAEPWPRDRRNRASLRNLVTRFDGLLGKLAHTKPARARPFDPRCDTPETPDEERQLNDWIAAGSPPEPRRRIA